ncbi:MAG: hypothetical protein QOJ01_1241, partial [Solirubrobacterales bacterium]|nr:hypothetical protein [Solirubrobacterales bacterium]
GSVWSLDVNSGKRLAEGTVGANPKGVAYADGKLFVSNTDSGTVSVLDSGTLKSAGKDIVLGANSQPRGIGFGYGSVWVAEGTGGKVAQINPTTRDVQLVAQKHVDEADGLAVGPGGVWTANGFGQTVARINPTPTGKK